MCVVTKELKPEGVASMVAPSGGPGDLLQAADLPLSRDHLGELDEPGVASVGSHSPVVVLSTG